MGNILNTNFVDERPGRIPQGLTFNIRYRKKGSFPMEEINKVKQWVGEEPSPSSQMEEIPYCKWAQKHIVIRYKSELSLPPIANYLEDVWNFAKLWCSQTQHVTRTYVTLPQIQGEDTNSFSAEISVLMPGTWEDSNRFATCPPSMWSGISEGCIKFKLRWNNEKILLYVKMQDEYFCLQLENGMVYQYLSFTVIEGQTELFLHLKDRPLIHKLKKQDNSLYDVQHLDIDDKQYVWNRTVDIGENNRRCLGKSDVLKLCMRSKRKAIEMISLLLSRKWQCRFLQVQERDLKQRYIDNDYLRYIFEGHEDECNDFEVRYIVDMLMSRHFKMIVKLTQGSWLLERFLDKSTTLDHKKQLARKLLEICDTEPEWFNEDFEDSKSFPWTRKHPRASQDRLLVRHAEITPTQVILHFEQPTDSCRILRENQVSCFLQVAFRDENHQKLTQPPDEFLEAVVAERLLGGMLVAGHRYFFLGGSASYLKDHGCALYRQDDLGLLACDLRQSVGDLSRITSVAKYLARLGLAFSKTSDGITVKRKVVERDIKRKNPVTNQVYCFSDGIGRISQALAQKEKTKQKRRRLPSAIQFRMGGAKGVLSLDPQLHGEQVILRDSMVKFDSDHDQLDIQSVSKPKRLFMNHQIVTLLSQLGVEDGVFFRLQEQHVDNLLLSLFDESKARDQLSVILSGTVRMGGLKKIGCQVITVPLFRQLLLAHIKQELFSVLKKARFAIPPSSGRNLMGVLDETCSLEYGEVFVQYSDRVYGMGPDETYHILTEDVVVSKMPCLHPGDVRRLKAVDKEKLHHLKDVIVFPQKGKRPHPNEMSGSDLDGDEYWVTWLPELLIKKNREPMDFPDCQEMRHDGEILERHMIDYLMNIIQNDLTHIVARAHLTQADANIKGIFSEECLKLAALHSQAVDAQKTGQKVTIPDNLHPTQWPDFLQKEDHKPTYESQRILGKLYRQYRPLQRKLKDIHISKFARPGVSESPDALVIPGTNIQACMEKDKSDKSVLSRVAEVRQIYDNSLQTLMNKYGLSNEIQVLTQSLHQSSIGAIRDGAKFTLRKRLREGVKDAVNDARHLMSRQFHGKQLDQVARCCFATSGSTESFPWIFTHWLSATTLEECAGNKIEIQIGKDLLDVVSSRPKSRSKDILSKLPEDALKRITADKWLAVVFLSYAAVLKNNDLLLLVKFVFDQAVNLQLIELHSDVKDKSLLEKMKFWKSDKDTFLSQIADHLDNELPYVDLSIAEKIGKLAVHILMSSLHKSVENHVLHGWVHRVEAVAELVQTGDLSGALGKNTFQNTSDEECVLTLSSGAYKELLDTRGDLLEILGRKGCKVKEARLEETKGIKQLIVKGDFENVDRYVKLLNKRHTEDPKQPRENGHSHHGKLATRNHSNTLQCFNCQDIGHFARDCPNTKYDHNKSCYNCAEVGHLRKDCPHANLSPDITCYNCDQPGHVQRDCPFSDSSSNKTCFNCSEVGHLRKECPYPVFSFNITCFRCDEVGHLQRDCPF